MNIRNTRGVLTLLAAVLGLTALPPFVGGAQASCDTGPNYPAVVTTCGTFKLDPYYNPLGGQKEATCTDSNSTTIGRGDCATLGDPGCADVAGSSPWTMTYYSGVTYTPPVDPSCCPVGGTRSVIICEGLGRCSDTPVTIVASNCTKWTVPCNASSAMTLGLSYANCLRGESYEYKGVIKDVTGLGGTCSTCAAGACANGCAPSGISQCWTCEYPIPG